MESYEGGSKSGLAIQNPGDEEKWRRMQQAAASAAGPLPSNAVTVTAYRNGFTVGDGPLRTLSDPINRKFMEDMAQGRSPDELQALAGGGDDVHVQLVDKRSEDYKEPAAPAYVKFSGEGNTLG
eukprot:184942-Amphidinium_carterae.1